VASTLTLGLEFSILASNIAVFVGVALEYWDVRQEIQTEPGHSEYPDTFGTNLYGKWIRLAALGWNILTIGLLLEVLLTPCLIVSQFRDERRWADHESQQQQRIEQIELELQHLKSYRPLTNPPLPE
jgi:hypothetical protein